MFNRRKFLEAAAGGLVGIVAVTALPITSSAREATAEGIPPVTPYRGPRMTFLAASSLAAMTGQITDHIASNADRRIVAVCDTEFSSELSPLCVSRERPLSGVIVGMGISQQESHRNLSMNLRDDPDELVFQDMDMRYVGITLSGTPRDQLNYAWETGHHVTSGLIASSLEDVYSKVRSVINGWPYGLYFQDIDAIYVVFNGSDVSSSFRDAFRADPSNRVVFPRVA